MMETNWSSRYHHSLVFLLHYTRVIAFLRNSQVEPAVSALRAAKVGKGLLPIPSSLEIGWVPPISNGTYPGLFLFSNVARMIRPVRQVATSETEYIGPFEQVSGGGVVVTFFFFAVPLRP